MIRGFYTAASGIVSQEKNLNTISNNLSNANTVGYKRDNIVMGTFGEHLSLRMDAYPNLTGNNVGEAVYMQIVDDKYTNHAQGGFEQTTRPFDMGLMGEGMFVIVDDDGNEYLTRDGQFSLDEDGYLILPGYGMVQGQNGDIQLTNAEIEVTSNGDIYIWEDEEDEEMTLVDRILVALPEDYSLLEKAHNGLFTLEDYDVAGDEDVGRFQVRQFYLEKSNVNMAEEMTNMLASQRALQSCSQIVKMYDEMSENINSRVSRVN